MKPVTTMFVSSFLGDLVFTLRDLLTSPDLGNKGVKKACYCSFRYLSGRTRFAPEFGLVFVAQGSLVNFQVDEGSLLFSEIASH
jgi:hypothetical protein